jgi:hypothetical protein
MTTFNTGNPIGSTDPRDLYDNAQVIDDYANSGDATTTDRLGVERATIAGIDAAARNAIANAGYEFVGDYAAGIELTAYNQVVRDTSGEFWRVSGSTALPYTTTGTGMSEGGAFVTVGDAALRQELASPGGGDLVTVTTSTGTQTVGEALDRRVIYVDTIADLQALDTSALVDGQAARVSTTGRAGDFIWRAGDFSDEIESDPGAGIWMGGLGDGGAWFRTDKKILLEHYGVDGSFSGDISEIIEHAVSQKGNISTLLTKENSLNQSRGIFVSKSNVDVDLNGVVISYSGTEANAFAIEGSDGPELPLTANTVRGSFTVSLDNSQGELQSGDIVRIISDELSFPGARAFDTKYEIATVESSTDSSIQLLEPTFFVHATSNSARVVKINAIRNVRISGYSPVNENDDVKRGIYLSRCVNANIAACSPEKFNNSCIELDYVYRGEVSSCSPVIYKDTDGLNYGITAYRSRYVAVIENSVVSKRTAIDLTRLSSDCYASNNTVVGNINTHTVYNCVINGNTIREGSIFIRGPQNTVDGNNMISTSRYSGIVVEEAGKSGPSVISNNVFFGRWASSIFGGRKETFTGNSFTVTSVSEVGTSGVRPMFRANPGSVSAGDAGDGVYFNNNVFSYVGNESGVQVINYNLVATSISNAIFSGNQISGFSIAFDVSPLSDIASSKNLIIAGNLVVGSEIGVKYRLTDNVSICNNVFDSRGASSSIQSIQWQSGGSSNRAGLIIKNNIVDGTLGPNDPGARYTSKDISQNQVY